MRIVGGQWRGRKLLSPESQTIRPTTDRMRESLFNILEHNYEVADTVLLDLFAGTGALGFEALSRQARFCLFVDQGKESAKIISAQQRVFSCEQRSYLVQRDATNLGHFLSVQNVAPSPFNLVFCDPPYGRGLGERALVSCLDGGWLQHEALVIVEEKADYAFQWPQGFESIDSRIYGESQLVFGRFKS